jgi:hypothetical protein
MLYQTKVNIISHSQSVCMSRRMDPSCFLVLTYNRSLYKYNRGVVSPHFLNVVILWDKTAIG